MVEVLAPVMLEVLDPTLVYGTCSQCHEVITAQCPTPFHLARLIGGGIPSLAEEVHHYLKSVARWAW
jgi:hypothetical protein